MRWADPSSREVLPRVCVYVCVFVCVTECDFNPLHLQWIGRRGQREGRRSDFPSLMKLSFKNTPAGSDIKL